MTISQTGGPSGSQYIPDYHGVTPSLEVIFNDITTLTTDYEAKKVAMLKALQDYDWAKTQVDNQVNVVLNLVAHGASQADINAARTLLTTYRDSLTSSKTSYTTACTDFETSATLLLNAKAIFQQSIDNDVNTQLDAYVPQLDGKIDTTLYDEIVAANTNRQTARAALNTAVNNYRNLEKSIKDDRIAVTALVHERSLARANAIINNPTLQSQWATLVAAAEASYDSQIVTKTAHLSGLLSTRTSFEAALTTAIDNFQDAFDHLRVAGEQAGLITLFEEARVALGTEIDSYIQAMKDAKAAADAYVDALIAAQKAADEAARLAHEAATGNAAALEAAIAQAHNASTTSTATVLSSDFLKSLGLDITFPALVASGGDISMMDLMGFITSSQLMIQQIKQHANLSDDRINQLRMQIWEYILSLVAQEYSLRMSYLMDVTDKDTTYEDEVKSVNTTRYDDAVKAADDFNKLDIDQINALIDAYNAESSTKKANYDLAVNAWNEASQGSTDLINEANKVQPDAVNLLNLYGIDPTMAYPALLTAPTAEVFTTLPHISKLPDPPVAPASQADIDAYNNTIRNIAATLDVIQDKIDTAIPNIDYQMTDLVPLVYRDEITIRDFDTEFDFDALQNSVNALLAMIKQTLGLSDEEADLLTVDLSVIRRSFREGRSVAATGTGVGFQTAFFITEPTLVETIAIQLMGGQDFRNTMKDLLDQGTFIAALPVALRRSPLMKNYSIMGMLRGETLTDIERAALQRTQDSITARQLQVVADQLLSQAENVELLRRNAMSILAKDPRSANLTATQANAIITRLTVMQQEMLTTMATLALVAAPGTTPGEQERALRALLGRDTLATIDADLKKQGVTVSASLTPGSPAYYEELLNNAENITPADGRQNFREKVTNAMAKLGILPGALTPGVPLGTAVRKAMEGAAGAFVDSLGINLGALPPDVLKKAQSLVQNTLGGMTNLSEEQKLKLAIAISGGVIAPANVEALITTLTDLQTGRITPQLLAKLDDLNPREIPKQLRERVQDITERRGKDIELMTSAFMKEQNPVKFAVDYLLSCMHFLEKQFSGRMATPAKSGRPPTTAMPV